jgi:hypothetical protein
MSRPASDAPITLTIEVAGLDPARELLGLASTVLDLLWLHPALVLLAGRAADGTARIALWPLLAVALLARGWVAWWERRGGLRGSAALAQTAVVGLVSVALLIGTLALPYLGQGGLPRFGRDLTGGPILFAALLYAGAAGFIWWRSLSGHLYGLADLYTAFGRIIGTYLAYMLIAGLMKAGFAQPVLVRDLYLLFAVGLGGLVLARARADAARSQGQLDSNWLLTLLGGAAAVLALGLLIGGLFGGDIGAALLGPLNGLLQILSVILLAIVSAISQLVFALLDPVLNWLQSLGGGKPPPPLGQRAAELQRQLAEFRETMSADRPQSSPIFAFIGVAILVVVLLWLGRRILHSAERRRRMLGGGERESLFNWQAVLDSLTTGLRPAAPLPDPLLALEADPRYRYTVRIRRAYRRALAQAAAAGTARRPDQTPSEVLPALQAALPAAREPVATLTALYTATRYTTTPATPADAEAADAAAAALTAKQA